MNGTYITDTGLSVSSEVYHAILAAKMRPSIGRYAARVYALKHTTARLYRMACQLSAASVAPSDRLSEFWDSFANGEWPDITLEDVSAWGAAQRRVTNARNDYFEQGTA